MNLYQMTGPNDRGYPPDEEWDDLCLEVAREKIESLTRDELIERLLQDERTISELKQDVHFLMNRGAK